MRNRIKQTWIFLLAVLFFLPGPYVAWARPRLSVRAFEDRTVEKDDPAPAGAIMDMMVTELDKAKIFDLIEREKLDYIAQELRLAQEGLLDPETAPQIGKLKGVQYTMTGAITLFYYNEKGTMIPIIHQGNAKTAYVMLELRIIDNTTGQIVYSAEQLGTAKRELKGWGLAYGGFYIGSQNKTYGGILASATREAVIKHVAAIKARGWPE